MPTSQPNMSAPLAVVYATDEDLYLENPADWYVLVPKSNKLAVGADGVFAPSDLWTLTSATNNFQAQGVTAGNLLRVDGPKPTFNAPDFLVVQSAAGNSVTLRRPGPLGAGVGLPPSPAGGLTGVSFQVYTFAPQIENAAYALNEQFAVDPNITYRTPGDIYDQRVFRRLTALRVMYTVYATDTRSKDGDFAGKLQYFMNEYRDALATAMLRWGKMGITQEPTTRFSMRLER